MASFFKLAKIYEKHESKFLNSALIVYLCFGAFLFNYLGEFTNDIELDSRNNFKGSSITVTNNDMQQDDQFSNKSGELLAAGRADSNINRRKTTATTRNKQTRDLNELRLTSVRRMWNITNRLNILYESNWTLLVLDELVEFERSLLETLSSRETEIESGGSDVDVEVEVEIEIEAESEKESPSGKKSTDKKTTNGEIKSEDKSTRSIKKSFFHSLATITTVASPHGTPKSSSGKLATVLYGALGIPILLVTVTKTGNHLAHSTLNTILIVRHYCFSIPIHYLCCSCNLYLCFRWLSWCCCCCCCSYIFCLTSDKDKGKCCDSRNAPKLKLKAKRKRRESKSDLRFHQAASASGAIYQLDSKHQVENANNLQDQKFLDYTDHFLDSNNQRQKSVRFSNKGGERKLGFDVSLDSINGIYDTDHGNENGDGGEEGENLYSSGVFLISLIIVGTYLSTGAYVYSRNNNLSLIDGLFEVYSLLSTSKMPDSFSPKSWKQDITSVYKSLKSNTLTKNPSSELPKIFMKRSADPFGTDAFIWETLYLICGLHLLSMCGHFARLWLSGKIAQELSNCQLKDLSMSAANCNGHIPSIMGALNVNSGLNSFGDDYGQIAGNIEQKPSDQHLMQASLPAAAQVIPNNPHIESHIPLIQQASDISSTQQQQQQPQEVNLAELFVVTGQNGSPADLHYTSRQQQQQQVPPQQQQTSDISFASTDRSTTDRGSLCLHHQARIPNVTHTQSGAPYYNPSSTYTHQHSSMSQLSQPYIGSTQHHHNHNHENNQQISRLYPAILTTNSGQGIVVDEGEGDDDDDDDDEMNRMLKSCLNGSSKLPSSSSLLHLSSTQKAADSCLHQHVHKHPHSSTMSSYKTNGYGCNHSEQQRYMHQRFGSLTRDTNRLRFGLDNGSNGCEQDSSLNTTADANTLSSSSGRTVKIIHNQEQSYPNGVKFSIDETTSSKRD